MPSTRDLEGQVGAPVKGGLGREREVGLGARTERPSSQKGSVEEEIRRKKVSWEEIGRKKI